MASSDGSDAGRPRTEQEREHARQQRERLRVSRAGSASAPVETPPLPPPPLEAAAPGPGGVATRKPRLPPRGSPARAGRGRWIGLAMVLALLPRRRRGCLLLRPRSHPAPAPPPPKIVKLTIPEGYTRAQIALRARADGVGGSYAAASSALGRTEPRALRRAARHAQPRRVLVSGDLRTVCGRTGRPARRPAANRVRRKLRRGADPRRQSARAHLLSAVDRGLDGRARGAGPRRSREDRGRHLQPPARRDAARHRRHHLLRGGAAAPHRHLYGRTDRKPAAHRLPLQHAPAHRPAADADLQSRPGLDRSGRAPRARAYLYYVAGADGCGEQAFSDTAAQFESDVAAYTAAVARAGGKPPVCKRR